MTLPFAYTESTYKAPKRPASVPVRDSSPDQPVLHAVGQGHPAGLDEVGGGADGWDGGRHG